MKLQSLSFRSAFSKAALATAFLGGFLLFAGASGAKANAWDNSNRRVSYTEMRYREAVHRFGPYSRDARYWAAERREAIVRAHYFRRDWR